LALFGLVMEGREVNHEVVNPNEKGNVAELAIATEAARLGLSVLKPLTEHERYDLVLGVGGELLRVQCKWAASERGIIRVRVRSSYHSPTRGHVVSPYDRSLFEDRKVLHLRLDVARNNQRAALNWAAQYEFSGAVAQLEERRAGSAKVRGSSPLSSTAEGAGSAPSVVVGAHQFRNRFGYYLERASRGDEIQVLRRGRPFARLCPPA
jgi:prevent-host-death family protein